MGLVNKLEARITQLEAQLEEALKEKMEAVRALQLAMEFNRHMRSQDGSCDEDVVEDAASQIRSVLPFIAFAFYIVGHDFPSFNLAGCYPSSKLPLVEREKDVLIEDGSFAWALEVNRRTVRTSSDESFQVMLHPIATSSRVMGMFVGIMPYEDVPDVKLVFLSVILNSLAGSLQNRQLFRVLKELNGELVGRCFSLEASRRDAVIAQKALAGEAEEARRNAKNMEERIIELFDSMEELVVVVDRDLRCLYANPAFLSRRGLTLEHVKGLTPEEILGEGEYARSWRDFLSSALAEGAAKRRDMEVRLEGRRSVFDASVHPMRGVDGFVAALGVICRDVTEKRAAEEVMKQMSYHDPLTGLYNRRFFEEEMRRLDTERQLPICVLMGDVDGLKLTNDVFGHHEGDRLLVDVAERLKNSLRKEDVLARWGGDEFVVLLPKTDPETAAQIARRLSLMEMNRRPVPYKITFGVGVKRSAGEDMGLVLKRSEDDMYALKLKERDFVRENIVKSLMVDLGSRSCESPEHRRRVANLCIGIGRCMGLDDEEMEKLMLLGEYHDVGMVEAEREMLTRPGFLDEYEWSLVRKHPETGYRIANASSADLVGIAGLILHHHENYDGTGYPHGLSGDRIPLLCRIFRVADSYEVITSGRPYRPPLSEDAALEEISSKAGTWYDPMVVRALAGLVG
ncbi:MAG: diguanylate cyclase [Thermanaerothrix sp.]|nr:diguanylate cyclase [Thermanaerothrix sp.]